MRPASATSLWLGNLVASAPVLLAALARAAPDCVKDTGGTCWMMSCWTSRGATCVDSKCMCPDGFCSTGGYCKVENCSEDGACPETTTLPDYCISDTGGSCAYMGCWSWRGNTSCNDYKCLCESGYCSIKGICVDEGNVGTVAVAWYLFDYIHDRRYTLCTLLVVGIIVNCLLIPGTLLWFLFGYPCCGFQLQRIQTAGMQARSPHGLQEWLIPASEANSDQ